MIGIIDYGMGNLMSLSNALKKINVDFSFIENATTPPLPFTLVILIVKPDPFAEFKPFEKVIPAVAKFDPVTYPEPAAEIEIEFGIFCNAVDPTTWTPCTYESRESQNYTINRPREFTGQTELEKFSSDFLKVAWPDAGTNDRSVITFIFEYTSGGEAVTKFESHELVRLDSVDGSNWNYVRKLS